METKTERGQNFNGKKSDNGQYFTKTKNDLFFSKKDSQPRSGTRKNGDWKKHAKNQAEQMQKNLLDQFTDPNALYNFFQSEDLNELMDFAKELDKTAIHPKKIDFLASTLAEWVIFKTKPIENDGLLSVMPRIATKPFENDDLVAVMSKIASIIIGQFNVLNKSDFQEFATENLEGVSCFVYHFSLFAKVGLNIPLVSSFVLGEIALLLCDPNNKPSSKALSDYLLGLGILNKYQKAQALYLEPSFLNTLLRRLADLPGNKINTKNISKCIYGFGLCTKSLETPNGFIPDLKLLETLLTLQHNYFLNHNDDSAISASRSGLIYLTESFSFMAKEIENMVMQIGNLKADSGLPEIKITSSNSSEGEEKLSPNPREVENTELYRNLFKCLFGGDTNTNLSGSGSASQTDQYSPNF